MAPIACERCLFGVVGGGVFVIGFRGVVDEDAVVGMREEVLMKARFGTVYSQYESLQVEMRIHTSSVVEYNQIMTFQDTISFLDNFPLV